VDLGVAKVLRIYFSTDDVARTRIAPAPDPLWELVMSLQLLRPQPGDLLFRDWRRTAGAAIRRAALGERLRLLLALTPRVGYFPDFLNPSAAIDGLEHGLEAIRSTPATSLGHDLRRLAKTQPLPTSAQRLVHGEPGMLTELTNTMRTCYHLAITPHQRAIAAAVERDRQLRTRALASGGVEGLLASLRPMMSWSSGELRIPTHRDQELHLNGRGLLLIPSYFCLIGPVTMFDPTLPPVVVYSVAKPPDALPAGLLPEPDALAALIGATRVLVLETICGRPMSTTDIARRIGISAGTASEHTTVMRQAGLITSNRERNRMLHQVTPLGQALLAHAQWGQSGNVAIALQAER
jgi:DNA-binding transcriptional ArsR family regulator